MGSVVAFGLLFGVFGALVGASLLLGPDSKPEPSSFTPRATATLATAVNVVPTSTPTPAPQLNLEEPTRYTWVLLLEITPPGEEIPTLITKRQGAYFAPDRAQETMGGTTGTGEPVNRFVTVIADRVWERSGGQVASWTPVDIASPALDYAGEPPYWNLFSVVPGILESAEPDDVPDDFTGTPSLLYELTLDDLPTLQDYLLAHLNDALPELEAGELVPVPVRYWLTASDGRPIRIRLFPPEEVAPNIQLSFNIQIYDVHSPSITIEAPSEQP